MNALGKDGTLLQMAKLKARDIVGSFGESDKYQFLTNDFEGRHQRYVSKEELLPLIDEVKGLVDAAQQPTINPVFFPNTLYGYWSSSPSSVNRSFAWSMYFTTGSPYEIGRFENRYVRLVRVGR